MSKIKDALELIAGKSARVISYRDEFAKAWELVSNAQERASIKDLVLVWDDIPAGNTGSVATALYLTPIDLAVSLSLAIDAEIAKSKGELAYPELRIMIFDLASRRVADSPAVRFVAEFPRRGVMSMPWIRLFRLAVTGDAEWDAVNLIENLRGSAAADARVPNMCEQLSPSKPDAAATGADATAPAPAERPNQTRKPAPNLDALKRVWASFLTKPNEADDHHALANLTGPVLLLGKLTHGDENVKALVAEMRALGLIRAETKDPQAQRTQFDSIQPLTLLMIDDQWRQGWGEVLCRAAGVPFEVNDNGNPFALIGSAKTVNVKAADSVDWLVTRLENISDAGQLDQRFEFKLDDESENPEVLFLDLRLFSGAPIDREAAFIEALSHIAVKLSDGSDNSDDHARGQLPWKGFSNQELELIKKWVSEAREPGAPNSLRDDPRYLIALTLLPRILALIDPAYPIVLFSSTDKRTIVELLKKYGNIFSGLSKPSFSNQFREESLTQFWNAFGSAARYAITTLATRKLCREFVTFRNPYENALPKLDPKLHYHVEFYIDETNPFESATAYALKKGAAPTNQKKGWRVGGCFAVFAGADALDAQRKADAFEDALVSAGVRYFKWLPNGPQPPATIERKALSCKLPMQIALKSGDYIPVRMGVASLVQVAPAARTGDGEIFDPSHDDRLFSTTLTALVEAFLAESAHAMFSELPNVTFSLFAATRINVIENRLSGGASIDIARRDEYRAGVEWGAHLNGAKQYTFCEDHFVAVVRSSPHPRRSIIRAVARPLCYLEKNQVPEKFICLNCILALSKWDAEPAVDNQYDGTVVKLAGPNVWVDIGCDKWGYLQERHPIGTPIRVKIDAIEGAGYRVSRAVTYKENPVACTKCGQTSSVRPDTRALHYVADQILTDMFGEGKRAYKEFFDVLVPGEFEDSFDDFPRVLAAGRALESPVEGCAQAALLFPHTKRRIVNKPGAEHKPALRDYVKWRIGEALRTAHGDTLLQIARGVGV